MRATYNKDSRPIDPDNIDVDLASEHGEEGNEPLLVQKEMNGHEQNNGNDHIQNGNGVKQEKVNNSQWYKQQIENKIKENQNQKKMKEEKEEKVVESVVVEEKEPVENLHWSKK